MPQELISWRVYDPFAGKCRQRAEQRWNTTPERASFPLNDFRCRYLSPTTCLSVAGGHINILFSVGKLTVTFSFPPAFVSTYNMQTGLWSWAHTPAYTHVHKLANIRNTSVNRLTSTRARKRTVHRFTQVFKPTWCMHAHVTRQTYKGSPL